MSGAYPVYEDSNTFCVAVVEVIEEEDYTRFEDDIVFQSDGSIEVEDKIVAPATRRVIKQGYEGKCTSNDKPSEGSGVLILVMVN